MLAILFRREGFDVTLAPGFHAGSRGRDERTRAVRRGAHRSPDARRQRARPLVARQAAHGAHRGHRDDRARDARDGHRGDEARRVRLRHEAVRHDRAARAGRTRRSRSAPSSRRTSGCARSCRASKPSDLLGNSEPMRRILDLVQRIANARTTVLITGESGTGKERIARAIHDAIATAQRQAVPRRQLRRHPRGAHRERALRPRARRVHRRDVATHLGIFREAEGGTVLLDEIGELATAAPGEAPARAPGAQGARASGRSAEVTRRRARARRDEPQRRGGRARRARSGRTSTTGSTSSAIEVPPLRDRREDIRQLAEHFLARCAAEHNKDIRGFSPDALRALDAYAFPGNVRELENVVERAVALATGPTIGLGDLPPRARAARPRSPRRARWICPRTAATSTTCSARSSGGSSCRRSSGRAACGRRPPSCSASPCAACATACRSTPWPRTPTPMMRPPRATSASRRGASERPCASSSESRNTGTATSSTRDNRVLWRDLPSRRV